MHTISNLSLSPGTAAASSCVANTTRALKSGRASRGEAVDGGPRAIELPQRRLRRFRGPFLKQGEAGNEEGISQQRRRKVVGREAGICASLGDDGVAQRDGDSCRKRVVAREVDVDSALLERRDDEVAAQIRTDTPDDLGVRADRARD